MGPGKGNSLGHPRVSRVICPDSEPRLPRSCVTFSWLIQSPRLEWILDYAVPSTASPSLAEEQARTLPMPFMTPVTNAFPKESLFPLPFAFPLQLATCHNREKQHRQHTKEAQSLWQSSAEVNTALRCQSVLPSPAKSNKEANHRDISIPLLNLPWVLLTFHRLT